MPHDKVKTMKFLRDYNVIKFLSLWEKEEFSVFTWIVSMWLYSKKNVFKKRMGNDIIVILSAQWTILSF